LTKTATIILLLACLASLAACGGSTFAVYDDGHTTINQNWRGGASWDPFAPAVKVTDVRSAVANAPARNVGAWQVVALDRNNQPDAALAQALRFDTTADTLRISAAKAVEFAALYVRYDGARQHVLKTDCAAAGRLALAGELEPGLLSIGVVALDKAIPAGTQLAAVQFAAGASQAVRRASYSQFSSNIVTDLTVVDNGDETATLGWSERNTGDYDLNSEVNVSDIVPIAQHYTARVLADDPDYAILEVIDGDENTEINSADLVPIAMNLGSTVLGYNIYRTALAAADETPDPALTARWAKLENEAAPSGPSIVRSLPTGQSFRLHYTFHDECGTGDFGWYVSAYGPGGDDTKVNGPASPASTKSIESTAPPEAAMSMSVMPPYSEFLNVDDEFYVAVRVDNITGLSSVNVRLEYDSSLLELVDGTGEYESNANLLSNYLFLAVDEVGSATSPYKLMGFNITQKQGTAVVTGSGVVGYLRFRATGSGVNAEAIRFPQATTYLLLWGEQYGVPVATPGLGSPVSLNIG
jgi:hypothetical protein